MSTSEPKTGQLRKFRLFYDGSIVSHRYGRGRWIVDVRAKTVKQAYYFVGKHVRKGTLPLKAGIYRVDHNQGPSAHWPWSFEPTPDITGWLR